MELRVPLCRLARAGDKRVRPATQASIAVSGNGTEWVVVGASPDLRQQIQQTPRLWPRAGLRDSPIAGVVLIGGDVDALAGLLVLRERQPFTVYAPRAIAGPAPGEPHLRCARSCDGAARGVGAAGADRLRRWAYADVAADAGKGSALPRGTGRDRAGTGAELCRTAGGERPPRDRRTGMRRDHAPACVSSFAGPMRCSSTARCSPTTR